MYPVKIKKPDARLAKIIMEQYGGPDGEMGASIRYLSQRFAMVTPEAKAILNDVGTSCTKMPHFLVMKKSRIAAGFLSFYQNKGKRQAVSNRTQ